MVAEIADRVAILYQGEKVEENTVHSIFNNAQHPYTKGLIACRPALHPKGEPLPTIQDFVNGKEKQSDTKKATNIITSSLLLEVKNLTIQFPAKRNIIGNTVSYFTAVDNVSFSISEGETVGLVGESGCGKTTLGRALLRIVQPTNGSIKYKNTEISKLSNQQLKSFRKEVQLVFQDPFSSLNPKLIIGDAIAEPIVITQSISVKERKKRINELLGSVKLPEHFSKRYPHEFSGGQRQRIVIARALSLNPAFLVCDESVSALDVSVQAEVLNLLNELKARLGLTMLFISHDLSVVRYMCDKIMVMEKGKIVEEGNSEEVYTNPKTFYTRKLIESIPKV